MTITKVSFLCLVLFISVTAQAKRVIYLPPISTDVLVGAYDTSVTPKQFCELDFSFKEQLFSRSFSAQNRRTSGALSELYFAFRNVSGVSQNVNLIFEGINFEACYWQTSGKGAPQACVKKYFNNNGAGYTVPLVVQAKKAQPAKFQLGCQGDNAANNCYLFLYPLFLEAVQIQAATPVFGVPAIWNSDPNQTATKFLCYKLSATINARIEVVQDKGALLGGVETSDEGALGWGTETNTLSRTNYKINSGRPF